jgi:hypothetical protein
MILNIFCLILSIFCLIMNRKLNALGFIMNKGSQRECEHKYNTKNFKKKKKRKLVYIFDIDIKGFFVVVVVVFDIHKRCKKLNALGYACSL